MLESMRKHTRGWIAKVILGAIILSFALWGVGDYFTGNQVEAVAKVDGQAILDVDFRVTYERQLQAYANMLGEQFSKELAERLGVKNETIQTMINRKLMLIESTHMGLVTPDEAVLATVQGTPQFREADKGFSPTRYQALIRQMGFISPRDYENYLRQNITIDTLQNAITSSATVSDAEVEARFKANFEKRVFEALIVDPESLKANIEVTDDEARDWYESHASMYQAPLKVVVNAVEINQQDLIGELSVSDDAVAQAYAERQAEFGTPEKRRAAHILIRVARDASAAVKQDAREKINAAKARIDMGEAFADVAKDVSDDVTSSSGGDLGFFARGAMVPEFEEAAFDVLEIGQVSDVVESQFGYHLVQLNEIQAEEIKPLADVEDDLREQLLAEMAVEEAFRLSGDLDNALGMEDSLAAAAKVVNLPVLELGALSQENVLANKLLSSSEELQKKVFQTMPGSAVEIIEIENGYFVALEVLERIDPATLDYEDVVKRVYDDVRNAQAIEQAQNIADKALATGLEGKDIDGLAQQFAQAKFVSKPVRSNGEGDDAVWLSAVLTDAFRTPEGRWVNKTIPTAQGIAVVFVKDVQEADDALFAEEEESLRTQVKQAKGAVRFARWMSSLRDRHDIEINERVLSRF
ncbi:MAG TPA: peptidyl-prolyl cis-trans isomerase [Mariprofundaceae bacterium]|nr:peptidyl-prolyl cis-trans isomerase [Mariprofundaceae bacterium]